MVSFEDTGARKPDAQSFQEILKRLGVTPQESLMVGDWPERDVAGANALGMRTVLARYGFSWSDESPIAHHPADHEIHDLLELVSIVDRLNASAEARP